MPLDPYLRNLMGEAYPEGYRAPSTFGITTQLGQLDTRDHPYHPEDLLFDPFPQSLALRVKLEGVPMVGHTQVLFSQDEMQFPPHDIYERPSARAHQAVRLIFQEAGFYVWRSGDSPVPFSGKSFAGLTLEIEDEETCLYEKVFLTQRELQLVISQKMEEAPDGETCLRLLPLNDTNVYPLWAYGGYFAKGCGIQDIQQTVFTLTPHHQPEPLLEITSSSIQAWTDTTFVLNRYRVHWMDDFQEHHHLSLAGTIEEGHIPLTLSWGKDHQGKPFLGRYVSTHFKQTDTHTGFVEIMFNKQED